MRRGVAALLLAVACGVERRHEARPLAHYSDAEIRAELLARRRDASPPAAPSTGTPSEMAWRSAASAFRPRAATGSSPANASTRVVIVTYEDRPLAPPPLRAAEAAQRGELLPTTAWPLRAKTAAMNAAYARRMARRVARVGDDDSGDAATKFDSNAESPVAHLLLTPPLSSRALADALGPALAANLSLAEFETAWHAAWHKLLAVYAYLRYEMSDGETLLLLDSDAFIAEPDVDARDFLADVRARRVRYGDGQHAPLIGSFITSVVGATLPAFDRGSASAGDGSALSTSDGEPPRGGFAARRRGFDTPPPRSHAPPRGLRISTGVLWCTRSSRALAALARVLRAPLAGECDAALRTRFAWERGCVKQMLSDAATRRRRGDALGASSRATRPAGSGGTHEQFAGAFALVPLQHFDSPWGRFVKHFWSYKRDEGEAVVDFALASYKLGPGNIEEALAGVERRSVASLGTRHRTRPQQKRPAPS